MKMHPSAMIGYTSPRILREVFGVTYWLMSDGELRRLALLRYLDHHRLDGRDGAERLGLPAAQVFRCLRPIERGPAGWKSRSGAGRPIQRRSPRRSVQALSIIPIAIGFGPTLWRRSWANGNGITRWPARRCACGGSRMGSGFDRKQTFEGGFIIRVSRRECAGELCRSTGAKHWVFGIRPQCTLLVFGR